MATTQSRLFDSLAFAEKYKLDQALGLKLISNGKYNDKLAIINSLQGHAALWSNEHARREDYLRSLRGQIAKLAGRGMVHSGELAYAEEIITDFSWVLRIAGVRSAGGPVGEARPYKPKRAVKRLLKHVRESDDPMREASVLLTMFTNGVAEITSEIRQDS